MISHRPVPYTSGLRPGLGAPMPAAAPPPAPDVLYSGYDGVLGLLETILVLGATSAGAYVGIRTATGKESNPYIKAAGWVGGVGAALAGLLYLGEKTGVGEMIGLPAVRISPS